MAGFSEGDLDYVLVPIGFAIMLAYQIYFLYVYRRNPTATVLGMESLDKKAWIDSISKVSVESRTFGSIVMGSSITVSTFLASVCLTLSSLLSAWLANSSDNPIQGLIYGSQTVSSLQVKLLCLLVSFLAAFSCFLESARQLVHASFLATTSSDVAGVDKTEYVKAVFVRGGEYTSYGLRALYFGLALLLWFFGPIPMILGSVVLTFILYFHDTSVLHLQSRRPATRKAAGAGPSSDASVSKTDQTSTSTVE
ncbi:hypothetical protein SAY87_010034 [Trapa incisa]|uniref:DUF599 domain-containing protein n=2 Tax=Trapa TaxID=22665 RepID=A0AAN7R822_TRANT|nr:hypothetical protein SAY87_010034 [Trapa incisa]KAK4795394.1 hypothetical protein SAY86_013388 [Trapa natans]